MNILSFFSVKQGYKIKLQIFFEWTFIIEWHCFRVRLQIDAGQSLSLLGSLYLQTFLNSFEDLNSAWL